MSVARVQDTVSAEDAKSDLLKRFEKQLEKLPVAKLLKIVRLPDEKAFAALAKPEVEKSRSAETRIQAAISRMVERGFQRLKERCELLDASEAHDILGFSKQALSQKTKQGLVLAYSMQRRKFYPSFQFTKNKVHPAIPELVSSLGLDPNDSESINKLIQHLVGVMDYSNAGEPSNEVQRFKLLDEPAALEIIKRDFINSTEMGQ